MATGHSIASSAIFAESLLLSAEQLAQLLAVSSRTIRRLDSAGKLPRGLRVGGLKRWRRDEITHWIEAGCPNRSNWVWPPAA